MALIHQPFDSIDSYIAFFGNESVAQIAREAPYGFWSVSNRLPDSQAISDTWQVINTLTWTARSTAPGHSPAPTSCVGRGRSDSLRDFSAASSSRETVTLSAGSKVTP